MLTVHRCDVGVSLPAAHLGAVHPQSPQPELETLHRYEDEAQLLDRSSMNPMVSGLIPTFSWLNVEVSLDNAPKPHSSADMSV